MADRNNTTLSLCADKVLDHVGASEQIRRNHVEKALTDEVAMNLVTQIPSDSSGRYQNVGSWCEGTTTKGLDSDKDAVISYIDVPALEQIPDELSHGYLIVNDGTTKPSYVKLQIVYFGHLLSANTGIDAQSIDTDKFGRLCLRNDAPPSIVYFLDFCSLGRKLGLKLEVRGPAITVFGHFDKPINDQVLAFRCESVPSFTREWIHRRRKYGWPTEQQLDKMSQYGCFLVPKGHSASQKEHIEWRISFSLQERELMFNLSSTQHKCYILLKMIKQDLVSKTNVKSISSYHLKTALFYTIENNPTHIWIADNLVYCTELCLKQLLYWLNNENCPNFFVPGENMFDRLSSDVMKIAATFIRDTLDSDGQYLKLLTCDKFGELLQECLSGKVLPNLSRDAKEFDLYGKILLSITSIDTANSLVISANRCCTPETLIELKLLLKQLKKSEERLESEKVFREIKQGFNLILPTIHLQIAQTIAAIMLNVTDADEKPQLRQELDYHIEKVNGFDGMSQKLIEASLMFRENKLEECVRILTDCETQVHGDRIYVSPFTEYTDYGFTELNEIMNTTRMSPLEFRRTHVASWLMFLPSQADLVPTPLHYEMYRSIGTNPYTMYLLHYWHGAIAIDAKLYLFFLQYLVYTKLNKRELAVQAVWKLTSCLFADISTKNTQHDIVHLETGFNLFGWICKQEKYFEVAAWCFRVSWKIRPDHNAAKWHMLVMMYEIYIQSSKR